jgi:hypothetical protein
VTAPTTLEELESTSGQDAAARLRGYAAGVLVRVRRVASRERWFVVAFGAAVLVRLCVIVGYYPIMWYNDGFEYVGVANRWQAYPIRPDGYSAMLVLLRPLHSFALVAVVQHAMGLAVAVLLYALMRRFGVRRWLAVVASLPQLFDTHQIELEHLVLSDTLFTFLVVLAVTVLVWSPRLSLLRAAVAGLSLSAAVLTRTVGLPILLLALGYVLIRWAGWRNAVAFALIAFAPLAGYATWYHHEHGQYSINTADGVFLYARVAGFADCSVMHPSPHIAMLCDPRPSSRRPPGPDYIWHPSPLDGVDGKKPGIAADRFTADRNDRALSFALLAIRSQPLDYLHASLRDVMRSFRWSRQPYPSANETSTYRFSDAPWPIPGSRVIVRGASAAQDVRAYEQGDASTHVHPPWSGIMRNYQRVAYLRGTFLGVLVLVGGCGILVRRARHDGRGRAAFVWTMALALIVVPDFTAQFDYRYLAPAVPLVAAAAGLGLEIMLGTFGRSARPARVGRSDASGPL